MTLNIEFLAWDRYIHVAGLNMLMGSTPLLVNWISNDDFDLLFVC
jgi:hypothetical protein